MSKRLSSFFEISLRCFSHGFHEILTSVEGLPRNVPANLRPATQNLILPRRTTKKEKFHDKEKTHVSIVSDHLGLVHTGTSAKRSDAADKRPNRSSKPRPRQDRCTGSRSCQSDLLCWH